MKDLTQIEQLNPLARRAWKRLEMDFPLWVTHLDCSEGEMEFSIPAPTGSTAGHLVAFSHENQWWVRFSPPHLCYPADDENEMVSLIKQLTADNIVFKVVMKGDEWVETTLITPEEKWESSSDYSIRVVSWSGKFDR